ncbi:MAG: hypothetical protein IKS37_09285 [Solobacterium sp.]|nr:hypothetical protein [Solobacterium sp.]
MIVQDALRSLRHSLSQAVFYWLTLLLTTTFLYLYFILMMSDPVTAGFLTEGTDFLATAVTVTVVIICMIAILYANNFFVRRKAPELAVRLISGATYTQLSMYLLLQTLILMAAAMPLGIVIGRLLLPVLSNAVSMYAQVPYTIEIRKDGIVMASVFLGFVVFWIIMLNLSFAYRNAANMLFHSTALYKPQKSGTLYLPLPAILRKTVSAILFLGPIAWMAFNPAPAFLYVLISSFGMVMFIKEAAVPYLTKRINGSDSIKMASLGFLRRDIQVITVSTILYFTDAVLLLSAITLKDGQPVEMAMYMLSYVIMNLMLALALLFQFSSELSARIRPFATLSQIGCTPRQQKQAQNRELLALFGILLVLDLLYTGALLVPAMMHGRIEASFALILFALSVIPLLACGAFCHVYYRRCIAA